MKKKWITIKSSKRISIKSEINYLKKKRYNFKSMD